MPRFTLPVASGFTRDPIPSSSQGTPETPNRLARNIANAVTTKPRAIALQAFISVVLAKLRLTP